MLLSNSFSRNGNLVQTDVVDLFGSDLPMECEEGMKFAWSDGILLQGLNAILDHRAEVFIPELGCTFKCTPSFRVFACQNPSSQGEGKAFQNHFLIASLRHFEALVFKFDCFDLFLESRHLGMTDLTAEHCAPQQSSATRHDRVNWTTKHSLAPWHDLVYLTTKRSTSRALDTSAPQLDRVKFTAEHSSVPQHLRDLRSTRPSACPSNPDRGALLGTSKPGHDQVNLTSECSAPQHINTSQNLSTSALPSKLNHGALRTMTLGHDRVNLIAKHSLKPPHDQVNLTMGRSLAPQPDRVNLTP
ncbi:hypothetical protein NE237_014966 [Protea cynaroides]|uniref:Uncharacterized protein n=1 Tax=Protea cynaroides TaxID=273540 RepID=A0A9Q0QQL9_9MAGN|nr:hypothetical protein NE237_014966 [Protea cynaroides]